MNAIFLGGDLRQQYACDFLNRYNIDAEYHPNFSLDKIMKNKINSTRLVVFPIPLLQDNLYLNGMHTDIYEIVDLINTESIIFGGQMSEKLKNYISVRHINFVDVFDIESFQIQNAMLSAEGAIYYAKEKIKKSIHGLQIAIFGFGRIGKLLAYLLHCQGAKITVCVRKDSDFTWSKLIGFDGFKIKISGDKNNLNLMDNKYDLVFNTIPFWIMDEEFARNNISDTIIIDLASYPFGIDENLVNKYKLKYFRELGIPGRYAPQTAGEIIGQTILNSCYLKEV